MRTFAVPRLDPPYRGFHLIWTGPELLVTSLDGYLVERRRLETPFFIALKADIGLQQLDDLAKSSEIPTGLLGPLRYAEVPPFSRLDDPAFHPPRLPERTFGSGEPTPAQVQALLDGVFGAFPPNAPGGSLCDGSVSPLELVVQELARPWPRARLTLAAQDALCLALFEGKVVDLGLLPLPDRARGEDEKTPRQVHLGAPAIDTLFVYTAALDVGVHPLRFEVGEPSPGSAESWTAITRTGLPLCEADSTVCDPDPAAQRARELALARSRLLPGETIDDEDGFARMADALRPALTRHELGRAADRILLTSVPDSDSPVELSLEGALGLVQQHPLWRRAIGFGYADLDPGLADVGWYEYRVTGTFFPDDLADRVYTVHAVPAGTVLPHIVHLGDLGLRFHHPPRVVLHPAPSGSRGVARRGIEILAAPPDRESWVLAFFLNDGTSSVVVDLPRPVTALVLEVGDKSSFVVLGGATEDFRPVPLLASSRGPHPQTGVHRVVLTFSAAITQLRLQGGGILFAVRIQAPAAAAASAVSGPVQLRDLPPPEPPPVLLVFNLQKPPVLLADVVDEETEVPTRHEPGFELVWLPPARSVRGRWPAGLDAAPPVEAIGYQIEHKQVDRNGNDLVDEHGVPISRWRPVQPGADNLTLGSRSDPHPGESLAPGADLAYLYRMFPFGAPHRRPGAGQTLHLHDVFGAMDPAATGPDGPAFRPVPPLGTYHRYRIRAMDAVGRVSPSWTVSGTVQLQKRTPPPSPVGPQYPDARKSRIQGVRARAVQAASRDLSAEDRKLFAGGAHENAIVLEWGWRAAGSEDQGERGLDPYTREFRLYVLRRPPDTVSGVVTSVKPAGTGWEIGFRADDRRRLERDEHAGAWLAASGYSFKVLGHGAGSEVALTLEGSRVDPALAPTAGERVVLGSLSPHHRRPASWDRRVAVVPLARDPADESYRYVFYDLLDPGPERPLARAWVGVSAADAEPYIPDEVPAEKDFAGTSRPGNESSLAVASVTARYLGRPVFEPPPLGPLREQVTEDPALGEVRAVLRLDATDVLGASLPLGTPIAVERCSAESVLGVLRLDSGGKVVLTMGSGDLQIVTFPSEADRAAVQAALRSDRPEALDSRYLLYLATQHGRPGEIWKPAGQAAPLLYGTVTDLLPPKAQRWFYRLRRADAAGRTSAKVAYLPLAVRVPSLASPPRPRRESLKVEGLRLALEVAVALDPVLTHVLLFREAVPLEPGPADLGTDVPTAELLRIPGRRDLYEKGDGIRLRTSRGTLLAPVIKALADADVRRDEAHETAMAVVRAEVAPAETGSLGAWVRCWCCALSRDGVPSELTGPFGIAVTAGKGGA